MPENDNSFDRAAEQARVEIMKILEEMSDEHLQGAKKILAWQKKWYLQAGHKRLGRILVGFARAYNC